MTLASGNQIEMVVLHPTGPGLKPTEIVKAVFGLNKSDMADTAVLKTRQILEAETI
jgi:hypothetical protein